MPELKSHVSFSVLTAAGYGFIGFSFFGVSPEYVLLATIIVFITGILPDVDETGGLPEQEAGGFLAAIVPLLIVDSMPDVRAGGIARVALVVICSYLFTRLVVVKLLQKFTLHRGTIHSIPAAIITFELVFLLFWDTPMRDRLYLSFAAFVGYLSHLLLDGWGNIDLVGRAMGKEITGKPALKVLGSNWGATIFMYGCMAFLGWFVMRDLYPGFKVVAGVKF